ncbi:hypothetical protein AVEN_259979-1 [Araneus ventricosus]|uniref:Uncharacterized protein n=1 Tax=Araneus ventricosus TaxID=182803 RepID=A0A4Y2SFG1_ARAVE|nr:hypothetical protein AVEN_259979-1 [Araneus ventricosus]
MGHLSTSQGAPFNKIWDTFQQGMGTFNKAWTPFKTKRAPFNKIWDIFQQGMGYLSTRHGVPFNKAWGTFQQMTHFTYNDSFHTDKHKFY